MPQPTDELDLAHGPTWKNRIALAPLTNRQSNDDGSLSQDEVAWLTARADGGFGLVMTAAAFVAPAGQVWRGQLGVASPEHLPACVVWRTACARPVREVRCNFTTEDGVPNAVSPAWPLSARGTTLHTMRWR